MWEFEIIADTLTSLEGRRPSSARNIIYDPGSVDLGYVSKCLAEIRRILKPEGVLWMYRAYGQDLAAVGDSVFGYGSRYNPLAGFPETYSLSDKALLYAKTNQAKLPYPMHLILESNEAISQHGQITIRRPTKRQAILPQVEGWEAVLYAHIHTTMFSDPSLVCEDIRYRNYPWTGLHITPEFALTATRMMEIPSKRWQPPTRTIQ